MARAHKKPKLIEFKGTTLPVVSVTLHSLHPGLLAKTAAELFGDDEFFDGDAALLELEHIDDAELSAVDWPAVKHTLGTHGLRVIGIGSGSAALRESAAASGLPSLAAFKRPTRNTEESSTPEPELPETPADTAKPEVAASPPAEPLINTSPPPPAVPLFTPTRVIDRPLRSGQQVYARGGDLVVLAAVNAGAEVIADGSIHIYAPLRGRALAGASGSTTARIFTTRFEAELVSIAGVYRTFAAGIPDALAGRPVQVQLSGTDADQGNALSIAALSTD